MIRPPPPTHIQLYAQQLVQNLNCIRNKEKKNLFAENLIVGLLELLVETLGKL